MPLSLSLLALVLLVQTAPIFTVGLRYDARDRAAWARDLPAIRALGFTAVVVPDDRVEPIRSVAAQAELRVIARRDENAPPLVVLETAQSPETLRYRGWAAICNGARAIAFALDFGASSVDGLLHVREAGAFASVLTANSSLFLTMKQIEAARSNAAEVDARLFESGKALVVIAVNHADKPQEAAITLPASSPLAEWVNLETGEVAYFDRVPEGVAHRHRFAPRDALVLVIRKDIQ